MTKRAARILKFIPLFIAGMAVFGFVVMALWNWLAPAIFGLPRIGYWQALGLFFLSKLLMGGFFGGHSGSAHWKHRMRERLERMTPEERERFLASMSTEG
jgi:Ca2+/H+ antiporter, TMEM165/GDT1 family